MLPVIQVTAGIIQRNGLVLLARRPRFGHLGGLWEFPGGKIENGESPVQCLARELEEELLIRIDPREVKPFDSSFYEYGMRRVLLIGMTVGKFCGVPTPVEHAEIAWMEVGALESIPLAPADVPLARRLAKGRSA